MLHIHTCIVIGYGQGFPGGRVRRVIVIKI